MPRPNVRWWLVPSVVVIILLLIVPLGQFGNGSTIVGAVVGDDSNGSNADYGGPVWTAAATAPQPATHKAKAHKPKPSKAKPSKPTPSTSTPIPTTAASRPVVAGSGTVVTARGLMLPLPPGAPDASLSSFGGQQAVGNHVKVQAVVANEGFWIGTSSRDRIWVQLVGPPPESPYSVRVGDRISFDAPVVAHSSGFAREVGVSKSEGADQLIAQGEHIAIRKTKLKLEG